MRELLLKANSVLWGTPMPVLILGVGIFLSLQLQFVQITLFPRAFREFAAKLRPGGGQEEGSSFRALCTALAATVGTGNLVGVAGAICLGGPGAVFWMWLCGILGMVTKYAEATLAVRYRVPGKDGWLGGPMYMITRGMGDRWRPLAVVYCLCGIAASFGVGNGAQVNAVVTGINAVLVQFGGSISRSGDLLIGVLLAAVIGAVLLGGARRIGAAAELLVPIAAGGYILLCVGVLIVRAEAIPGAFRAIVQGAFSPRAVTGGMLGSAFHALQIGCSRGVFTNEAGMGTASIAHAAAEVTYPARQGLMGIMEVFLDTILICTLTALVILVSGVPIPYGRDIGGELTSAAFASVYGSVATVLLATALVLFAVATVLGWSYYGLCCVEFLYGSRIRKGYLCLQILMTAAASLMRTETVWQLSEFLNGLMAIPNLLTLAVLAPQLRRLTKEYRLYDASCVNGGTYADFHQRKPL